MSQTLQPLNTPQTDTPYGVSNDNTGLGTRSLSSYFPKPRTVLASALFASLIVTSTPKKAEACDPLVCVGIIAAVWGGLYYLGKNSEPETKPSTPKPKPTIPQGLSWTLKDNEREIRSGIPEIIDVPKDVPIQIGSEISSSREIGFSKGSATGVSGGVNLAAIQASLQQSWDKSIEGKFEQSDVRTINLTLNWNVCDTWRIDYYKSVVDGEVTAPKYGADAPLPFTITTAQRLAPQKLCEDGTNIATNGAIAAAQADIEAIALEQ